MNINKVSLSNFIQKSYGRFTELSGDELKSERLILGKAVFNDKELQTIVCSGSFSLEIMNLKNFQNEIDRINIFYADEEHQVKEPSISQKSQRNMLMSVIEEVAVLALNDCKEVLELIGGKVAV